jgi:hypothetical protein
MMASHVASHAEALATDQFGNYIVQHVLTLTHPEVKAIQDALVTRSDIAPGRTSTIGP